MLLIPLERGSPPESSAGAFETGDGWRRVEVGEPRPARSGPVRSASEGYATRPASSPPRPSGAHTMSACRLTGNRPWRGNAELAGLRSTSTGHAATGPILARRVQAASAATGTATFHSLCRTSVSDLRNAGTGQLPSSGAEHLFSWAPCSIGELTPSFDGRVATGGPVRPRRGTGGTMRDLLVHAGEACSASAPDYTRRPSVPLRGRLDSHSWTSCSIHRTARLPTCSGRGKSPSAISA